MSKETETMKHNAEVAQFRFALIAPVIQGLFPEASATATTNGSVQHRLRFRTGHPLNTAIKPWKNGNPCTAPAGLTH